MTNILLVANLLALIGLGAWLFVLHRSARVLQASAQWLADDLGTLPADLRAAAKAHGVGTSPFYTIEILNPLEVAVAQSQLGKVFAGLTPALVRSEVYRQATGHIREELERRGIKAEVKLHA